MRALFDDLSVADNKDKVGVTDSRKAMRYHERRSAFDYFRNCGLNLFLCQRIDGRRSLVKNKHDRLLARVSQDAPASSVQAEKGGEA